MSAVILSHATMPGSEMAAAKHITYILSEVDSSVSLAEKTKEVVRAYNDAPGSTWNNTVVTPDEVVNQMTALQKQGSKLAVSLYAGIDSVAQLQAMDKGYVNFISNVIRVLRDYGKVDVIITGLLSVYATLMLALVIVMAIYKYSVVSVS